MSCASRLRMIGSTHLRRAWRLAKTCVHRLNANSFHEPFNCRSKNSVLPSKTSSGGRGARKPGATRQFASEQQQYGSKSKSTTLRRPSASLIAPGFPSPAPDDCREEDLAYFSATKPDLMLSVGRIGRFGHLKCRADKARLLNLRCRRASAPALLFSVIGAGTRIFHGGQLSFEHFVAGGSSG